MLYSQDSAVNYTLATALSLTVLCATHLYRYDNVYDSARLCYYRYGKPLLYAKMPRITLNAIRLPFDLFQPIQAHTDRFRRNFELTKIDIAYSHILCFLSYRSKNYEDQSRHSYGDLRVYTG